MVENFIAPIQFQQHVARLRNAGLITTERVDGEIYNQVKLTKKGEEMLAEAKELFSLVLKWSK